MRPSPVGSVLMSQPLIKLALIVAVLVLTLLAFRGSRRASHRLLWRGYGLIVAAMAGLSIMFPDSLTRMANEVGVRRGADLLLYVLVVSFAFVTVTLLRRITALERRYVELARKMALDAEDDPASVGKHSSEPRSQQAP